MICASQGHRIAPKWLAMVDCLLGTLHTIVIINSILSQYMHPMEVDGTWLTFWFHQLPSSSIADFLVPCSEPPLHSEMCRTGVFRSNKTPNHAERSHYPPPPKYVTPKCISRPEKRMSSSSDLELEHEAIRRNHSIQVQVGKLEEGIVTYYRLNIQVMPADD